MDDRFIIPNFHVILVHYPLALLLLGTAIELLSFLWPKSGVRTAGRWMILLGALSMLPTAASGMNAFAETEEHSSAQREVLRDHVWQSATASVLAAIAAVIGLGCSDRWRQRLRWPLLGVFVLSCALIVVGAWHAGEAVYRHGTNVVADPPTTQPSIAQEAKENGLAYFVPPLDGHLLSAGFTAAFAFGGLGVSYRRYGRTRELERIAALGDAITDALRTRRALHPEVAEHPTRGTAFWLIGTLLAVATALLGFWYLAASGDAWSAAVERVGHRAGLFDRIHSFLRELLLDTFGQQRRTREFIYPRRALHVANGIAIVLLMIGMTVLARWGKPRWKLLTLLSTLLLLALALQVWVGTLLLYEGPEGSVTGWSE